ncbi:MAG: hypothetical protein AAEJ04_01515 [Planctomycetota bacterium]
MLTKGRARRGWALLAICLLASFPVQAGSEVGDVAPAMKPGGWINIEGTTTWESLSGKLILIEKWATW